jgi:aminopeptidase N
MNYLDKVPLFLLVVLISCSSVKTAPDPGLETGVSRKLADYRKAVLSDIHYVLDLDIPVENSKAIVAAETLRFVLNSAQLPLQVDFKEDPAKITALHINGKTVAVTHREEHLILPAEFLKEGENEVYITFQAGEGALNRNADFLYTLFVPDRARTAFPCFDQPDLKATYLLTLRIPASWKALANAELKDSVLQQGRKIYHFRPSDKLSTYLFSFAAGKFNAVTGEIAGRTAEFLYRETDSAKINHSLQEVFDIHANALKYYERWTTIPYPFQKFGFVAIPDFQFGGMEHPGNIQYKSSSLFLDATATKDQLNARNNLIAHETAHMWFGDLVTMNWFTDVWMKEVFANFMADKSLENSGGRAAYDLKFLVDHVPSAFAVDRTAGANPIRQPLDNLKDAGTLYGNIIYHKAPVMMQQLELLMGKDKFQEGVREYLRNFANNNASWPDLISILDKYTPSDLQQWNKVWVNESGRPVVNYQVDYDSGKIHRFIITQRPEYGKKRVWPQLFELTLFYPDSTRVLKVDLSAEKQELAAAIGLQKPSFVLFNSSGQGYAQWPVDPALPKALFTLKNPLHRATAYISLFEQMLSGNTIKPEALLNLYGSGLVIEKEELNLRLLTGYISNIYWQFISPAARRSLSADLETLLWDAMLQQKESNNKKQLFKAYQDIFVSKEARNRLYGIWRTQKAPQDIKLAEDDYTSLAFALALRDDTDHTILAAQQARIVNPDRKKRFEFIVPAVSSSTVVRDQFFNSLLKKQNRQRESNVLAALYYLHHPLRQDHDVRYLPQSLDLLEEIQVTGDIFFPQSWLQATLGAYQSAKAADFVRDFLKSHPDYNPKLKAKILQTADNLFRAEKILSDK